MSRATAELLATVDAIDPGAEAANDEVGGEGVELGTWIDALALTLAAGVRVGARAAVANDDEDVLTVDDVAALLKLGRNAVYEAVGRGEVPHRRIGKQIRFSRAGIMRWLASCEAAGSKDHR